MIMLGSPMKTKVTTLIMLAAIATAFSCSKESATTENETVNMTPMTFSVNEEDGETKTALGSDNLSGNWTAGDKIAIFDNVSNTPLSFDVDATHNSASGSVTSSSTTFYAIYPYDAAATISGSVITTTIPTTQYAVAGGFAEEANVSVAYTTSTEKSFTFHNVCALVKFTVAADNVKSVTLRGKPTDKIAGKVSINYNSGVPTTTVDATNGSAYVTLKNSDNSVLTNGATYYIAVAPGTLASGMSLTYTMSDGSSIIKASGNSVTFARNIIKNLGSISGAAASDLYTSYQAGTAVSIAGTNYDKTTNGPATLINASSNVDLYSLISGKEGVYFLNGSFVTNTTNSVIFTKDLYLISDDPTNPASISDVANGKNCVIRNANLGMKNIVLNLSYSYFLNNTGATTNVKSIHIDGCTITTAKPILNASSVLTIGVNSIIVQNSKIKVTATVQLFTVGICTGMENFKELIFKNNIMFASSSLNCQVFNYADKTATSEPNTQTATDWSNNTLSLNNNIFYNITSANGLMRQWQVSSLNIGGNVYYAPNSGTTASRSYYLFSSSQDKTKIINTGDIYFNNGSTNTWFYSGNGYGQPTGVTN